MSRPTDLPVRSEKLVFPGRHGLDLAARLDRPPGPVRAWGVLAHCFTCTKDVAAATRVSRGLAARGFGVLRFDFTGLGSSDGDFANTNFSSNVDDLVAAAEFLREHHGPPRLLIGHSLGGAAVLAAARRVDGVEAVATINAPAEPGHVRRHLEPAVAEIEERGEADVSIAGRTFRIQKQFLDDIASTRLGDELGALDAALLVMHSPTDEVVGIDNARRIYEAARGYKSFVSLAGADHLLSDRADAEYVADVLSAWATRYVTFDRPESSEAPEGAVRVEEYAPPYTNRVVARDHEQLADEPASVKGSDLGMTPYEYLLAGLGACTSMTLRMYADRKEWPLERVSVDLRHGKVHASDCERCETQEGRIDRIDREVTLVGDLTDEQRERLLEIADRCPVHRTLEGEKEIRTRLVE